MEHRYHQRFPVRLKVVIYLRDAPSARGTVCNASRSGLFLETTCPRVHAHQQLELEFCLRDGRARRRCRVEAYVLRRAGNGVGLEIDESDETSKQSLDCVLDSVVDSAVPQSARSSAGRP